MPSYYFVPVNLPFIIETFCKYPSLVISMLNAFYSFLVAVVGIVNIWHILLLVTNKQLVCSAVRNYLVLLAVYLASLGFLIIHTLCIIKLCDELVAEMSLTIVTACRRSHSASNTANFDKIMSIVHTRWHYFRCPCLRRSAFLTKPR